MEKAKEYDWKDTNLAKIGSDEDAEARLESAKTEEAWKGAGKKVGIEIWRIEKFEIKRWPSDRYGEFFDGDSYIVLHTYVDATNEDKLLWDIHFWIGKKSSQDEYGTAAYKTVELDALFEDAAVQHREVQGNESKGFLALFEETGIRYLKGGIDSGFNKVEPEKFEPKLLHVKGLRGAVILKEIKRRKDKMNSGDVFILDAGEVVYQWNGRQSNVAEKMKAQELAHGIQSGRGDGTKIVTLDEGSDRDCKEFWDLVPGDWKLFGMIPIKKYKVKDNEEGGLDAEVKRFKIRLFRLSDSSGKLTFKQIAKGDRRNKISRHVLDSDDAFVLDTGFVVIAWIGKGASSREKGMAMSYCMDYLKKYKRPSVLPLIRISEGHERPIFSDHFHDDKPQGGCVVA